MVFSERSNQTDLKECINYREIISKIFRKAKQFQATGFHGHTISFHHCPSSAHNSSQSTFYQRTKMGTERQKIELLLYLRASPNAEPPVHAPCLSSISEWHLSCLCIIFFSHLVPRTLDHGFPSPWRYNSYYYNVLFCSFFCPLAFQSLILQVILLCENMREPLKMVLECNVKKPNILLLNKRSSKSKKRR